MAPISEILTSDIDHISAEDIRHFIATVYHATFVAHPYISGFLLIMWSYHPKAPFQALAYICWTLPKEILIWAFRLRGFQLGGETIEPNTFNDHTPSNIPFTRYQSYGAVNELPDVDGTNNHLGRVDELNIWWRLFGMALYLFGLTIMLVYGSTKG